MMRLESPGLGVQQLGPQRSFLYGDCKRHGVLGANCGCNQVGCGPEMVPGSTMRWPGSNTRV